MTAALVIGQRQVPLVIVRNLRARRYVLRVRRDGVARLTIPRGGSLDAAKAFAERNLLWIERQLQRLQSQPIQPVPWEVGSEILFRGEMVRLEACVEGDLKMLRLRNETLRVADLSANHRPAIENYFQEIAVRELPTRLLDLAAMHGLIVRRVMIRDQKTRWGSCSRHRTISLNWRLVQTPGFVSDYIILHELMHLRQMNHSMRFWREVERVCPEYGVAELWLKRHSDLLRR